jgi:hypothetical protein
MRIALMVAAMLACAAPPAQAQVQPQRSCLQVAQDAGGSSIALLACLDMRRAEQNALDRSNQMRSDFLGSCQSTCRDGGTPQELCTTYCHCGLVTVEVNDLWGAISSGTVSPAQQSQMDASNRQCSELIYPELRN